MGKVAESLQRRYRGFLGIQDIPAEARNLINKYLLINSFGDFFGSLSGTFFILFIIDAVGYAQAAVLMALISAVQLVTDYPSGSLGDWIGQRTVFTIALILFMAGNFLLVTAETFSSFAVIAVLFGLGAGQASGTMDTWLDNNYKKAVADSDPDKKTYGFCLTRVNHIFRFGSAIAFIIGGLMATLLSRNFVFFIQSFFIIPQIGMVLAYVKNIQTPNEEQEVKPKRSLREYFGFLKGGIKFLVSGKVPFLFLTGSAIMFSSFNIWGTLILFPIYFGYTGSDVLASVLRTTIFLIGIPIGLYMTRISKNISTNKLKYFYFPFFLIYYPAFIFLVLLVPPMNTINIIGIIATIAILTVTVSGIFDISDTLRIRCTIDLVPSENRNSVYSLIPTMVSIAAILTLPIAGVLTETYGLSAGITSSLAVALLGSTFLTLGLHLMKHPEDTTPNTQS